MCVKGGFRGVSSGCVFGVCSKLGLGVIISTYLKDDADSVEVGLISNVRNAEELLLVDEGRHLWGGGGGHYGWGRGWGSANRGVGGGGG